MRRFLSNSEEETIAIGGDIAESLPRKCVVLLIGNLGAGKTTLVKGIASRLDAADATEVTSPTFPLIHEYGENVYHVDLYRLDTAAEVESLGLDEIFDRDAIVLVEWGERFPALMPEDRWEIRIIATVEEAREIEVFEPQEEIQTEPRPLGSGW